MFFVIELIVLYQPFVGGRVKVVGCIESRWKILSNICHHGCNICHHGWKIYVPYVKSFAACARTSIALHIIWKHICLMLRKNGHMKLWCMKHSFDLVYPTLSVEILIWAKTRSRSWSCSFQVYFEQQKVLQNKAHNLKYSNKLWLLCVATLRLHSVTWDLNDATAGLVPSLYLRGANDSSF